MVKNFIIIIECPICATQFEAETKDFPSKSRQVKCSSCAHVWRISKKEALLKKVATTNHSIPSLEEKIEHIPEATDILTGETNTPEEDVLEEYTPPKKPLRFKKLVSPKYILWCASTIILVVFMFYFARYSIIYAVPASKELYEYFKINTGKKEKLKLFNTSWTIIRHHNHPSVLVQGHVKNISTFTIQPPAIRIKLSGKGECLPPTLLDSLVNFQRQNPSLCLIAQKTVPLQKEVLHPMESIEFSAIYPYDEPTKIKEVLIDFDV